MNTVADTFTICLVAHADDERDNHVVWMRRDCDVADLPDIVSALLRNGSSLARDVHIEIRRQA